MEDKKKQRKKGPKKLKIKKQNRQKNSKVKLVDNRYRDLFEEVEEDIEDYLVLVKGDGACGSTCTALAYHMDEKLGPYVRTNMNA